MRSTSARPRGLQYAIRADHAPTSCAAMPARASRTTINPQEASFRMASVPTSAARAIRVSLTKSTIRSPAGVNRIRLVIPAPGGGLGHRYDAVDDPAGGFEEALRVLIAGKSPR